MQQQCQKETQKYRGDLTLTEPLQHEASSIAGSDLRNLASYWQWHSALDAFSITLSAQIAVGLPLRALLALVESSANARRLHSTC